MIVGDCRRNFHSWAGLGLALLLHIALLLAMRNAGPDHAAIAEPASRLTMVMIAPPAPAAARLPERKLSATQAPRSRPARKDAPLPAKPQAITPAPVPGTAPPARIDVDAAVRAAGRMPLEDERPVSQLKQRQAARPTADEALGRDIARSVRTDCRTAHAGKGLFAPLFLAADAISDRGCKW